MHLKRLFRFSLRSLLLASVLVGSALTLRWHWAPWGVERTLNAGLASAVAVAFSADGNSVAVALDEGTIRVHALGWNGGVITFNAPAPPMGVAFSGDGKLVAACCADNSAHIWELPSGKLRGSIKHTDALNSVCFSHDGTKLLTSSCDGGAHIFSTTDGKELCVYKFESFTTGAVFSPDDRFVAVYPGTQVWDVAAKTCSPNNNACESISANCRWRITKTPVPRLEDAFARTQSAPLRGLTPLQENDTAPALACADGHYLGLIEPDGRVSVELRERRT